MSSRKIEDLTPEAQVKCKVFLKVANERLKAKGLEVFLTCTYRSQIEQDQLYKQGRTRPGAIVTWTRRSVHTQRNAWDVAFRKAGSKGCTYEGPWELLGQVAAELGIRWGGNFKKNKDRPHFQI
jgi:peptidoglycan L-alanyl-D-glutamate endopeptidase CwlK